MEFELDPENPVLQFGVLLIGGIIIGLLTGMKAIRWGIWIIGGGIAIWYNFFYKNRQGAVKQ